MIYGQISDSIWKVSSLYGTGTGTGTPSASMPSVPRHEKRQISATKLTREGRDNVDIANSKLNHDQRLSNTLNLTNRQKQTKTVKMIFEFNIPLAFIVLLFALFAWILFSISRRRKHAPLF